MKNFVRLSEVCTISASKANIEEECAWLLNLDKVESKTGRILEHEVVPREKLNGSIVQFDTENVLYSKLRPNLNKVVLPEENGYATSEMLPLRPCESKLTKGYLAEYLRSDNFVSWAVGKTAGAKMPRLGTKVLMDKMIPLPPLEEQHKIVSLFSVVNHVISLRQQQLAKLDELVKARFVEMFGNPVLNDKGWKLKSLSNLTKKIGSGATPKGGKEVYQENGVAFIRSMNVYNGKFEYKELAYISDEQACKLDGVTVKEKDVLLNITGASVARSCVVPTDILPARVNQHVCIIRCGESIIPEFLNKILIDDNYQNFLWNIAGSGATREAITKQQVENLQIITPPIERQGAFVEFCKQIEGLKILMQRSLEQMKTLKKALMQQYFG